MLVTIVVTDNLSHVRYFRIFILRTEVLFHLDFVIRIIAKPRGITRDELIFSGNFYVSCDVHSAFQVGKILHGKLL